MNTRGKHQVNARRHAVVLGGSLARMRGASLSDHFDHVTLIERDAYPETTALPRSA